MVILIEKIIREINLDIYRVIEFIFPHRYEFLYRLGLDGILVCVCCSPLNYSPSEPSDINKTWLIQVSGGNLPVPQIRVRNRELFFINLTKNMLCVLKTTVSMTWFF